MTRQTIASLFALLLLAPAAALAAGASGSGRAMGPQIGFSSDPNQAVFGGHLSFGNVAPELDFVPSVDIGLGDGVTVVSINGDFHYRFHVSGATWQPYAGAGVGLHSVSGGGDTFGSSDTVAGGNLIVGADVPTNSGSHFYTELRLALGDGPSVKVLAGWNFPMR